MTSQNLNDLRSVLEKQKTYYSLEIYPPEMYSEDTIIKGSNFKNKAIITYDDDDEIINEIDQLVADIDDSIEEEQLKKNNVNRDHINNLKLGKIIEYIKTEWLDDIPFYKYTIWQTVLADMMKLSNKFKNWIFVVYSKDELFLDKIWIKIFRNGRMIHASNNIRISIKLKLPNGSFKKVDDNGFVKLDQKYDASKMLGINQDKGLNEIFNIAVDIGTMLGQTLSQLGGLVAGMQGVGYVTTALSVAVTIVDEMQQNLIEYNNNKAYCKNMVIRCKRIVNLMQKLPPQMLDIEHIIDVVEKIEDCKNLINSYNRKWRITRFFASRQLRRQFNETNADLTDSFNDFHHIDRLLTKYQ